MFPDKQPNTDKGFWLSHAGNLSITGINYKNTSDCELLQFTLYKGAHKGHQIRTDFFLLLTNQAHITQCSLQYFYGRKGQ